MLPTVTDLSLALHIAHAQCDGIRRRQRELLHVGKNGVALVCEARHFHVGACNNTFISSEDDL